MANELKKFSLVLSGGAEKGYFQVGAFRAIVEAGYAPERIYGTSVGSLNGAFIAHAAALKAREVGHNLTQDDWERIALELVSYWIENIKQPSDIALQRSKFTDVWDILFNHFKGLSDTSPINDKIDEMLQNDLQIMAAGPVALKVASVDFLSGAVDYVGPDRADFLKYIKGSIAIPVMMPSSDIPANGSDPGKVLFDGGMRAVAPLGRAINDGARNIIAVLCQVENLANDNVFDEGKIMDIAGRAMDIVVNQNVANDVRFVDVLNSILKDAKLQGVQLDSLKKYNLIDHTIIRPEKALPTHINSFNETDIRNGIEYGYVVAKKLLTKKSQMQTVAAKN
jgi:NTE family protein